MIIEIMDTDETSTASMDKHNTMMRDMYVIMSMSLIVRHKNCVEC